MKLSERLARIASYIKPGLVVADIGTDHALLPVYLVREGICQKVIASDLYEGPVNSAKKTVASFGLSEQIEVRQGDGLRVLQPGEAEVVVIAGMGGQKIKKILESSPEVVDSVLRFVLQPQKSSGLVRRWFFKQGWALTDEDLVFSDEHFYEIDIFDKHASWGKDYFGFMVEYVERMELHFPGIDQEKLIQYLLDTGPALIAKKHNLLTMFLEKKIEDFDKVLYFLKYASVTPVEEIRQEWLEKKRFVEKVREWQLNARTL